MSRCAPCRWVGEHLALLGYLVLAGGMILGLVQLRNLSDTRKADRDAQTAEFCRAIPNASAAAAQALVDVLVADAVRRGRSPADTKRLGVLYVERARLVALRDLPSCAPLVER